MAKKYSRPSTVLLYLLSILLLYESFGDFSDSYSYFRNIPRSFCSCIVIWVANMLSSRFCFAVFTCESLFCQSSFLINSFDSCSCAACCTFGVLKKMLVLESREEWRLAYEEGDAVPLDITIFLRSKAILV